jgi:hypothetical protein
MMHKHLLKILKAQGLTELAIYVFAIPSISILEFGRSGALIAVLSSIAFAAYYLASSNVCIRVNKVKEEQRTNEIISMALTQYQNGVISKKAIANAINGFSKFDNTITSSMLNLIKMMDFLDFNTALKASINRKASSPTMANILSHSAGNEAIKSIKSYYTQSMVSLENTFSLYLRKANKYFTIQMLFSTILPSFALFGIAGYAILYSNAFILPIAFSLFAILLPLSYSISSKTTAMIYNAAF